MKLIFSSLAILGASWLALVATLYLKSTVPWLELSVSFVVLNLGTFVFLKKWRPALAPGLAYYGTLFFIWLIFSYGMGMTLSCSLMGNCL